MGLVKGSSYVVFDLETTGFSPTTDDIIEIGAWKFTDGVSIGKFHALVKPERLIPTNIMRLTGITNDELMSQGTSIEEVLPEFYDFLGDTILVGYNLPFDYNFIKTKGNLFGMDFSLKGQRMGIDVLTVVKRYGDFRNNKLGTVVEQLGIKVQGKQHRALYDAYTTKLVLDRFPMALPYKLEKGVYGEAKFDDALAFE